MCLAAVRDSLSLRSPLLRTANPTATGTAATAAASLVNIYSHRRCFTSLSTTAQSHPSNSSRTPTEQHKKGKGSAGKKGRLCGELCSSVSVVIRKRLYCSLLNNMLGELFGVLVVIRFSNSLDGQMPNRNRHLHQPIIPTTTTTTTASRYSRRDRIKIMSTFAGSHKADRQVEW